MSSSGHIDCGIRCLTRQSSLIPRLRDLTPYDLGRAAGQIRRYLSSNQFAEVLLSPFEDLPIDYLNNVIDVPEVGQLRFNTEPGIWASSRFSERYYSISSLFRREVEVNPLRRSAFFIVDFYQPGTPDSMLPIFVDMLKDLGAAGLTQRLSTLRFDEAEFDPMTDGPMVNCDSETRWVIARGYDASHSYFEVDRNGVSTRRELFMVTPLGFLEVGVLGITGWNRNPDYILRSAAGDTVTPDLNQSGMGFGLERLLLAEQILLLLSGARHED